MSIRFALFFFLASLALVYFKEALAYDLNCEVRNPSGTKYHVSTPKRMFDASYVDDDGIKVILHINDMLQPFPADDYVKHTDGKKTMTYSMDCQRG